MSRCTCLSFGGNASGVRAAAIGEESQRHVLVRAAYFSEVLFLGNPDALGLEERSHTLQLGGESISLDDALFGACFVVVGSSLEFVEVAKGSVGCGGKNACEQNQFHIY